MRTVRAGAARERRVAVDGRQVEREGSDRDLAGSCAAAAPTYPVRAELGIIDQMSACNANTLPWQPRALSALRNFSLLREAYLPIYAGVSRIRYVCGGVRFSHAREGSLARERFAGSSCVRMFPEEIARRGNDDHRLDDDPPCRPFDLFRKSGRLSPDENVSIVGSICPVIQIR